MELETLFPTWKIRDLCPPDWLAAPALPAIGGSAEHLRFWPRWFYNMLAKAHALRHPIAMRLLFTPILLLTMSLAASLAQETKTNTIPAAESRQHIGEKLSVTGKVAEVNNSEKLVRLNFDQPYPRNTFTAVVFAARTNLFKGLMELKGKTVEVTGKIAEYRGRPEIVLSSTNQLKVIDTPAPKKD